MRWFFILFFYIHIQKLTAERMSQSKNWCFTLNNTHNFDDLNNIKNWSYMVAGREVGENGTPHLQCYVSYKSRVRFSTVKNQIPRAHIELMRGTPQEASLYCKKDGDYMEFGTLPDNIGGASGGKRKAENFKAMIDLAKTDKMDDIADIDPVAYVQHYHAFKRIKQDHPTKLPDLANVCGEWIYGAPGVGKSYTARQENPDIYDKPANKWWDGYQGESVILIDDFDKVHHILGHHLKRWADRYSFPAEMKGTTVQIRPKKIVVTSNYSIEDIFSNDGDELVAALKRRFKVRHMLPPLMGSIVPSQNEDSYLDDDESPPTPTLAQDIYAFLADADKDIFSDSEEY